MCFWSWLVAGDCRLACWFACGYVIVLLWVSGLRSAADSFGFGVGLVTVFGCSFAEVVAW